MIMATPSAEIPEAITHVAVLEKGKIISKSLANQFKPDSYLSNAQIETDHQELIDLLSNSESTDYQTVVGMENVNIRYGDKQILNQLNWELKEGER